MSDTKSDIKILALVGSLRAASFNRQIAELAAKVAPDGVTVTMFEGLGDLPFYNEDIDTATEVPAPVSALREAASDAHAALVVTPEYNGSIPAVIKNAIDWLSRPFGDGALKDKPLAVIGGSMGRYGGVWAHDETRKSFSIAGTRVSMRSNCRCRSKLWASRSRTTPGWRRMCATPSATWPLRSADPWAEAGQPIAAPSALLVAVRREASGDVVGGR